MEKVYQLIKNECLQAETDNPFMLMITIMEKEWIPIHGPQHHVLDGACFLTAMYHAGVKFDLENALDEMIFRGQKMPGAICGQWGVCGSAASIGAALAIIYQTGPLSNNQYYKNNLEYVSKALAKIAEIGGPRCCKRNAYLAMQTAVEFVRERMGISLPEATIKCQFSKRNQQCLGRYCPFFE